MLTITEAYYILVTFQIFVMALFIYIYYSDCVVFFFFFPNLLQTLRVKIDVSLVVKIDRFEGKKRVY